jgi:orotate phosphoribosyltransferase-like protein
MKRDNLKKNAMALRKKGHSYSEIIHNLKIPKSTLSNWLHNIKLNKTQIKKIKKDGFKSWQKPEKKPANLIEKISKIG